MTRLTTIVPFLAFGLLVSMAQADTNLINIAGSQRMLTQRMMKNYALLGMGIRYGDVKSKLQNSITQFDNNLNQLDAATANSKANQPLQQVKGQWQPIRKVLLDSPNKEQATKLHEQLDRLMASSQEVVNALTQQNATAQGDIVSLAGRQRMLSQRMAALYALSAWRINDFDFMSKFRSTVESFRQAHNRLIASKLTTPAIRKALEGAEKSFRWFEFSAKKRSDKFIPSLILRASDDILMKMEEATRLYAIGSRKP